MMLDVQQVLPYLSVLLAAIALLGHAKNFFSSGEKVIMAKLNELETALAAKVEQHERTLVDHDRRIQTSENELKHMPNKDQVTDLKLALSDLRGNVGTLTETLGSVSRTVHRIDDWLREKGQ
ncbi:DUF2730 family protein [Rhizobium halophytocola]|uniref:Nucleic acid-binding Zn-ribbon protein n=1 Tax=Rhizobium halophytocola TaxID=735519 RepID=A0ABS4E441_9HYPH|nr:DUF2730 family protein [Rhizobium halophytocola]MBP1852699.1 putative nucleic acid-binding Zn-ribbon protein [Rhizobium halophytocola]